jgi:low temperature requirement protein LtrA
LAISQLSTGLYRHLDAGGIFTFLALSVPVWWAWVGITFYETRYDFQTDGYRLLILLAMVASTAMALSIHAAFRGDTVAFALGYAAVRWVLVALYGLARRRPAPGDRDEVSELYVRAFGAGALLWTASALVPSPVRYVVWGLGVAFDVGTPLLARGMLARHPVDGSHMPERFGAFVIIVLGESVVTVGAAVSGIHWSVAAVAVGLGGFVLVASVWWTYFDLAAEGIRRVLARSGASGTLARDAYAFGHFPLVVGLVAMAVGIEIGILRAGGDTASAAARWTMCGGLAAYLLSVAGVQVTSTRRVGGDLLMARVGTALLLLALAAAGGALSPAVFTLCAALVAVAGAAWETALVRAHRARIGRPRSQAR